MYLHGLDGWAYFDLDPAERLLCEAISERLRQLKEREREALAAEIINQLGKAMPS